jgi:hypothetical protein
VAQRRVLDLIESSLTDLRIDVHSAMNTNAKIITDWKELRDRFGPRRPLRAEQNLCDSDQVATAESLGKALQEFSKRQSDSTSS